MLSKSIMKLLKESEMLADEDNLSACAESIHQLTTTFKQNKYTFSEDAMVEKYEMAQRRKQLIRHPTTSNLLLYIEGTLRAAHRIQFSQAEELISKLKAYIKDYDDNDETDKMKITGFTILLTDIYDACLKPTGMRPPLHDIISAFYNKCHYSETYPHGIPYHAVMAKRGKIHSPHFSFSTIREMIAKATETLFPTGVEALLNYYMQYPKDSLRYKAFR